MHVCSTEQVSTPPALQPSLTALSSSYWVLVQDLKPANCLFDQYGQVKLTVRLRKHHSQCSIVLPEDYRLVDARHACLPACLHAPCPCCGLHCACPCQESFSSSCTVLCDTGQDMPPTPDLAAVRLRTLG